MPLIKNIKKNIKELIADNKKNGKEIIWQDHQKEK